MSTELKQMISLLDLTSLNEDDTNERIEALCHDAVSADVNVAAVCVYSQFVTLVKNTLSAPIEIATVVNFPHAKDSQDSVLAETTQALKDGANEIDLVLPYHDISSGNTDNALAMVKAVKSACAEKNACLKVIIESGAFEQVEHIELAAQVALDGGADFIKTSTGKIAVGATAEAVEAICRVIKNNNAQDRVGIKMSGGVRSVADANTYLDIIEKHFGKEWINKKRVRIGASSLLNDIKQAMA